MTTRRVHDEAAQAGRQERSSRARRVVVSLHGGDERRHAISFARVLASALGVSLHGLFTHSSPIPAGEVQRLLGLPDEMLASVVLDVEVGDPAERLVARAAREPDTLFVLSSPCEGLGKLAFRVLTASDSVAGVVIVRGDTPPASSIARILVPLDGTPSTARAIAPAGNIARRAHADLDIVYVVGSGEDVRVPSAAEPGSMTAPRYVDQPHHEWAAFSDEFLQRFLGAIAHCAPEVPAHMFLDAGDPAQGILRWADQLRTDLIVLAWHGHFEGFADGTIDEPPISTVRPRAGAIVRDVLRSARCPVLVLRA